MKVAGAIILFLMLVTLILVWSAVGHADLIDDFDSIFPVACGSNQNPNASGCSSFGTALYTFLAGESAGERTEYGWGNFVVPPGTYGSPGTTVSVPANDCLGVTLPGLTHTPAACYAYNANVRAVETGAITYPDNSTCWVGIDQNRSSLTGAPPHFSRVAGEHYLLDCIDAAVPAMTPSSQLLMKVTTAGGAITQVVDLRRVGSIPSYLNPPPGVFNVGAFSGFSSSTATTTVTMLSGSTTGTLASATGFNPGDQVVIRHGGASATIATPTGITLALLTDGIAVSGEALATGDGATSCFLYTLAHGRPKIGSVQVADATDGITSNYDTVFGGTNPFNGTGHGILTGSRIASGDVDWLNSRVGVCFSSPPSNGAIITVNYSYVPPTGIPTPKNSGCTKDATTDNGSEAGANCQTSWGVQVVAQAADGSSSGPSSMITIQNAPKYPSWGNRIRMYWSGDPNAVGYRIFACRDIANGNPANCTPSLIASNANIWYRNSSYQACAGCTSPTNYDYDYIGGFLPGAPNGPVDQIDGQVVPLAAEAADLSTSISTLNGTAVGFTLPVQQGGTFTVVHDIMPVINAALAAATVVNPNSQEIWLPCGVYSVATPWNLTNQFTPTVHGCSTGSSSGNGTSLVWMGGSAMVGFNWVNVGDASIENISFGDGNVAGTDIGSWFSLDRYGTVTVSPTHPRLLHDAFRGCGDCVIIANRGSANNENAYIEDTWIIGIKRRQYGYYIAGALQTNAEEFIGGGVNRSDVGWLLNGAGQVRISHSQGSINMVEVADGEPGNTSSTTQGITVENFFDQTVNLLFTLQSANPNEPFSLTDSYAIISNGVTPNGTPSTSQPTVPATGAMGMTAWKNNEIKGNFLGQYALGFPQQIWVGSQAASSGNFYMQSSPPFVPYSTTAWVASNGDTIPANPGQSGTYGVARAIGSRNPPAGAGPSAADVLAAGKISGFTTIAMPPPATTLSQVGNATNVCHYQIVILDSEGRAVGPSADNSIACPPIGSFNSANYVTIRSNTTGPAARYMDVLTSATRAQDTAHTIGSVPCSGLGSCVFYDMGQGVQSYGAPPRPNSADITMATGGEYHNTPTSIANLPVGCVAGDAMQGVSGWNGTPGVCSSNTGGSMYTTATCGTSNTWYCP